MEQLHEILIPEIEEKPHKNRKVTAGILAACILVLAAAGIFIVKAYYKDERALIKGFRNLAEEIEEQQELWERATGNAAEDKFGAMKMTTVLNLSGEELPVTLGIDTILLRDSDVRKLQSSTTFSVMNNKLAKLEIYGEDEQMMISLPDFLRQNLAFGTERIDRQYNNSLFAEKFGRIENQDISLDLFPEKEYSLWETFKEWERYLADWNGKESDEDTLSEIRIEKLDDSIEINVPEKNNKQYQCSQYKVVIPKERIGNREADNVTAEFAQDISFLIAIDSDGRIVRMALEEPLQLSVESGKVRGTIELGGYICFLGESRSIDDTVVSMQLDVPMEMSLQALQREENLLSAFGNKLHAEDEKIEIEAGAELLFDENDTSVTMELHKLTFSVNRMGTYKLAGNVRLEPLREEIEPLAGETIQLFEMTEEEYEDLENQIMAKIRKWLTLITSRHNLFQIFGKGS